MSQLPFEKPQRGRPPDQNARARVIHKAREILMTEGFGRLTIEAVAAATGVGKPTIYRSWANATELAMAALVGSSGLDSQEDHPDLRTKLQSQLQSLTTTFATTRGRQIALTLASADPESEYTKAFRNRVILASREAGRRAIEEAVAKSEFDPPADMEAVLDMIYGAVFYRLLVGHRPLDDVFVSALVDGAMVILIDRKASC